MELIEVSGYVAEEKIAIAKVIDFEKENIDKSVCLELFNSINN